jgi:hypothetical protein
MATLFERIGQPPPAKKAQEPTPAQKTLDWLQRWPKDTISVRDICQFGPRATTRTQRAVIDVAEVLERRGWLAPIPSHRRDRRRWQILRRLTVHPTVAA